MTITHRSSVCIHIGAQSILYYFRDLANQNGIRYVPIVNDQATRDAGPVTVDPAEVVEALRKNLKFALKHMTSIPR